MQFNVNIRPFKWQNSNAKITVKFDNAAINNWLNARWGLYSGFQIWLDTEVRRTIEPYVPFGTRQDPRGGSPGDLSRSVNKNTPVGSGMHIWGGGALSRPYAVFQYFNNPGPPRPMGGKRGSFWITRWDNDNNIESILNRGASKFGFTART